MAIFWTICQIIWLLRTILIHFYVKKMELQTKQIWRNDLCLFISWIPKQIKLNLEFDRIICPGLHLTWNIIGKNIFIWIIKNTLNPFLVCAWQSYKLSLGDWIDLEILIGFIQIQIAFYSNVQSNFLLVAMKSIKMNPILIKKFKIDQKDNNCSLFNWKSSKKDKCPPKIW